MEPTTAIDRTLKDKYIDFRGKLLTSIISLDLLLLEAEEQGIVNQQLSDNVMGYLLKVRREINKIFPNAEG